MGRVWNVDRIHPSHTTIDGAAELTASVIVAGGAPALVLESVAGAVGVIDREPLLVASGRRSKVHESVAAIERSPDIVEKCLEKAEIEKTPGVIADQDRVAPEDVILEHAGKGPGGAAIAGISIATLPEIRANAVELSPADYHSVVVGWIYGDRWLVGGVTGNILATAINVNLMADERTFLRDHSRRNSKSPQGRRGGRVVVFFEWLSRKWLGPPDLIRSDGKEREQNQKGDRHQGRPGDGEATFFHTVD